MARAAALRARVAPSGANAKGIKTPFPDVTDHVVEAKSIGSERIDGRQSRKAVGGGIAVRKLTLPDIAGQEVVIIGFLVAPGEAGIGQPAPCGIFPLRLAWQA